MAAASGSVSDSTSQTRFSATCSPSIGADNANNGLKFKIKRQGNDDQKTTVTASGNNGSAANYNSQQDVKGIKTSSKKKSFDPLTVKNASSNSDSGLGSGQSSMSSSAGSSPLSPAVLPGSPDPRTSKRNEPCTGRTPVSEPQPSPAKKMKTSHKTADNKSVSISQDDNSDKEVGTMTEPESLGPCEPGTAVKLHGIVWQETDKGLLVLNVTWKGKTFMGTLIDCQRQLEAHKWGPPRDALAARGRTRRGRNPRSRTPPVKSGGQNLFSSTPASPSSKCLSINQLLEDPDDMDGEQLRQTNTDISLAASTELVQAAVSPTSKLIECPKPECSKKYRDLDALKYHLSFAHNDLKKIQQNLNKARRELKVAEEKAASGLKLEPVKKEPVCVSQVKNEVPGDEVKHKVSVEGAKPLPTLTNGESIKDISKSEEVTEPTGQNTKRDPVVAKSEPFTNGHSTKTTPAIFSPMNHIPTSSIKQTAAISAVSVNGASHNHHGSNSHNFHSASGHSKHHSHHHHHHQHQHQHHHNNSQQSSQHEPKGNSRSISPAYSDISDEEPDHASPQNLASRSSGEHKHGLMNVRKEKSTTALPPSLPVPDQGRAPLDLTQPSFATPFPPPLRPAMAQFGLGSHLPPVVQPRFPPPPPPGLPTSTPSLNMLHSIMASAAKLQEFQQALGSGLLPLSTSGSVGLSKSNPFPKHGGLPPPPPLRHEHNHLHLGPGFPPPGLSVNSASSMASKMAMAAEVAKRAMPPATSGSPLHLAPHLSPFVSAQFGLGPPRLASPFPPKP